MQEIFHQKKSLLSLFLFIFFFSAFLITSGGHADAFDGITYFLMAENFTKKGSFTLNINSDSANEMGFNLENYIEIRSSLNAYQVWYDDVKKKSPELSIEELSKKYPFGSYREDYRQNLDREEFTGPGYLILPAITVPFYSLADSLQIPVIPFVFLIMNSLVISLACVVIFYLGDEIFSSKKIGFTVSLIFGFSSFLWPYITSMFSNPLALLFLILSIYLILYQKNKHNPIFGFLASISIGFSVLAHPQFFMFAPIVFFYGIFEFRKSRKQIIYLIIGVILISSIQFWVNYERFNDPLNFLGWQSAPEGGEKKIRGLEGVYGFLFSPGKSIFLYFPLSLLLPFGFYYLFQRNKSLAILLGIIFTINYLYSATSPYWYGISYWGPHRHFLPMIPIIAICAGAVIAKFYDSIKWKIGIISLAIFGFFVNLMGNLVWIQYAYAYGWGPEGLWKIQDKDFVFTWNPYHSPFIQSIKVLLVDWTSSLPINPETMNYFKVGLNGCRFDLYLYCEFGIIPIIILSIIVSVSAFSIMTILKNK